MGGCRGKRCRQPAARPRYPQPWRHRPWPPWPPWHPGNWVLANHAAEPGCGPPHPHPTRPSTPSRTCDSRGRVSVPSPTTRCASSAGGPLSHTDTPPCSPQARRRAELTNVELARPGRPLLHMTPDHAPPHQLGSTGQGQASTASPQGRSRARACMWPQFSARVGTPPPVAITQFLKGDSSCRPGMRADGEQGTGQAGRQSTANAGSPPALAVLRVSGEGSGSWARRSTREQRAGASPPALASPAPGSCPPRPQRKSQTPSFASAVRSVCLRVSKMSGPGP